MRVRDNDLSVLAYANGFTLWHYRTSFGEEPACPGFFAPAARLFNVGDLIVIGPAEGNPGGVYQVGSTDSAEVAIRPLALA